MANLKSICIAGICSDVPNSDDFATKQELQAKQDKLTAGENITISGGVISATDTTYTAGTGITITNGVISTTVDADVFVPVSVLPDASTADENKIYLVPKSGGGVEEWHVIDESGTKTWDKFGDADIDLTNYYNKTEVDGLLDDKQDTLTAGENIQITNGVISATDTTYENATQSEAGLMSAADKTKLDNIDTSNFLTCSTVMNCQSVVTALAGKQDTLTAGENITIANGVISATDTVYTAGTNVDIQGTTISVDLSDYYTKSYVDALEARIEALEALLAGKTDIEIAKVDYDNTTVTVNVLGEVV